MNTYRFNLEGEIDAIVGLYFRTGKTDANGYVRGWSSKNFKKILHEKLWRESAGRDVITGKPILLRDVLAHHMLHDQHGNTLKADCRSKVLVAATKFSNPTVEGHDWRLWQTKLIAAKAALARGMAPAHWDIADRIAFLIDRQSSREYLDFYF
ncbi:hypothetical protein LCGC14_0957660 [marine sediment metagenome]|uniref:Uncharacterized protein n=1 Tax=marine sediment metagenome TaxID=412755 RepID=A0A0F9RLV6_9ZZZZ|nr:MAG: hypothetical protein Lokiarch_22650 [Candidatus Lokiarchaeum sp. GC14_75]HDZ18863.1 hypothetical protein [archaeon]HEC38875.1 hypothetical protein [bacterium]